MPCPIPYLLHSFPLRTTMIFHFLKPQPSKVPARCVQLLLGLSCSWSPHPTLQFLLTKSPLALLDKSLPQN